MSMQGTAGAQGQHGATTYLLQLHGIIPITNTMSDTLRSILSRLSIEECYMVTGLQERARESKEEEREKKELREGRGLGQANAGYPMPFNQASTTLHLSLYSPPPTLPSYPSLLSYLLPTRRKVRED